MPFPSRTLHKNLGSSGEDRAGADWVVGMTHLVKPPFVPQLEAFSDRARFVHFDTRDALRVIAVRHNETPGSPWRISIVWC